MKKEITILTSWKGDIYELDGSIEDYIKMQRAEEEKGEDGFWSTKYRTRIKFKAIEKPTGKTQYISIEAPKYEPTQSEREESALILKKLAKKAEEGKQKRFIKRRNEILEDLRKKEVQLGIETTVDKIEGYNKLKLK